MDSIKPFIKINKNKNTPTASFTSRDLKMATNLNTNPFAFDEDDENEDDMDGIESDAETTKCTDTNETTLDAVASKLLKDNMLLTALELHTELLESGRELPRLRDYFSNPGNFERTRDEFSPSLRMQ